MDTLFKDIRFGIRSLLKRPAFAHENEVRVLYVEQRNIDFAENRVQVRFDDANAFFDALRLDPRLEGVDVHERTAIFKAHGYTGPIEKWDVYQGEVWTFSTRTLRGPRSCDDA